MENVTLTLNRTQVAAVEKWRLGGRVTMRGGGRVLGMKVRIMGAVKESRDMKSA